MQDGSVFYCCAKCRGLFPTKTLLGHHSKQCDGDVVKSCAKLFALDAAIAKTLPSLLDIENDSKPGSSKSAKCEGDSNDKQPPKQQWSSPHVNSCSNDDDSTVRKSNRIASKKHKTTFTNSGLVYTDRSSMISDDKTEITLLSESNPNTDKAESIIASRSSRSASRLEIVKSEPTNSEQRKGKNDPKSDKRMSVPRNRTRTVLKLEPVETPETVKTESETLHEETLTVHESIPVTLGSNLEPEFDLNEVTGELISQTTMNMTCVNEETSSKQIPITHKQKNLANCPIKSQISRDQSEGAQVSQDVLDDYATSKTKMKTESVKRSEHKRSNTLKKNFMSRADWRKQKADLEVKYKNNVSETVSVVPKKSSQEAKVTKQVYQCPLCNFSSTLVGFFDRHMKSVHKEKDPHVCEICGYKARCKGLLTKHRKQHLKPYICDICGSRHSCGKDLKRHYWKHTGEKPYQCDQCDYKSRFHERLKIHKRAHTGEREVCGIGNCTYSSQYPSSIKAHQSSVHRLGKVHQCPLCPYQTLNSTSLYIHRKRHTDEKRYACSLCDFLAHTKQAVERHLVKHTKEKEFQCDRCEYSTGHHSAFRTHMMNHLGVRPFQCSMCSYNSVTKQKVVRHITTKEKCRSAAIIDLGIKLDMDISRFRIKAAPECEAVTVEVAGGQAVGGVHGDSEVNLAMEEDGTMMEPGGEEEEAGFKVVHVYPWEEVTETISAVDVLETASITDRPAPDEEDDKTSLVLQECELAANEDGMQVLYIEPDLSSGSEIQVYYDSEQTQEAVVGDSAT